jgi:hypothetical protein
MSSENGRKPLDCGNDVSSRVAREVANALGADPIDIDPLYDYIDTDALNALFRDPTQSLSERRVTFTMEGCDVVVYGDGEIEVAAPGEVLDDPEIDDTIISVDSQQDRQPADGS